MKILIPILSLAVFLYLSYTAYQQRGVGYNHSEFDVLKPHSQAEALKDVWQLTDEDIARPVVLW